MPSKRNQQRRSRWSGTRIIKTGAILFQRYWPRQSTCNLSRTRRTLPCLFSPCLRVILMPTLCWCVRTNRSHLSWLFLRTSKRILRLLIPTLWLLVSMNLSGPRKSLWYEEMWLVTWHKTKGLQSWTNYWTATWSTASMRKFVSLTIHQPRLTLISTQGTQFSLSRPNWRKSKLKERRTPTCSWDLRNIRSHIDQCCQGKATGFSSMKLRSKLIGLETTEQFIDC